MRVSDSNSEPQGRCATVDYQCLQWAQSGMGRHIFHVFVHHDQRASPGF